MTTPQRTIIILGDGTIASVPEYSLELELSDSYWTRKYQVSAWSYYLDKWSEALKNIPSVPSV